MNYVILQINEQFKWDYYALVLKSRNWIIDGHWKLNIEGWYGIIQILNRKGRFYGYRLYTNECGTNNQFVCSFNYFELCK